MNKDWPAAYEKAKLLMEWWIEGRFVTAICGPHQGEKGFIVSITQDPHREPMMDLPGDPPLPWCTVRWPSLVCEPIKEEAHEVADIVLFYSQLIFTGVNRNGDVFPTNFISSLGTETYREHVDGTSFGQES